MRNLIIFFIILLIISSIQLQAQWEERRNGLPLSWAPACCISAIDENTAVIGTYIYPKSHIYVTSNAGLNWSEIPTPTEIPDINIIDIAMIDTNNIWICSAEVEPYNARIFATADGGESWQKQFENSEQTTFFNYIEMFDLNSGVAMGDAVGDAPALFLHTTDGGENWISINEDNLLGVWSGQTWARLDFVNLDYGYFFVSGISPQKLYKTDDGGKTWNPTNLTSSQGAVVKFFNANYGMVVENDGSIYRTIDGFASAQFISALTNFWPCDIEFLKEDAAKIWLTFGEHLFYSADSGLTWTEQPMPLNFDGRDIEFVDDKHGWILTPNSVFYTNNGDQVTGIENKPIVVQEFRLMQNYPNPFNPSTSIEFSLPKAENVTIEVYNTLGQGVETLLDKNMQAGNHEVEFNAQNLSSGIYFYRIEAGKFQDVKKMILIK